MNNFILLVLATSVLVVIPGPNVALIVANSLRYGLRMGVMTVLGTTAGVATQLALVVLGLVAIVEMAADALSWIKWAGVAYLIWLGIRTWREPATDLEKIGQHRQSSCVAACLLCSTQRRCCSMRRLCRSLLATHRRHRSHWSRRHLLGRCAHWRNRVTGTFLTVAGIGLALARR